MAAAAQQPAATVPDLAPGETMSERVDYVLAHLDEYKEKWREQARRAQPELTEAELDAQWAQAAEQFGI